MGLLLYAFGGHSQPACRQISRNVPVGISPEWFALTTRLPLFRKIRCEPLPCRCSQPSRRKRLIASIGLVRLHINTQEAGPSTDPPAQRLTRNESMCLRGL